MKNTTTTKKKGKSGSKKEVGGAGTTSASRPPDAGSPTDARTRRPSDPGDAGGAGNARGVGGWRAEMLARVRALIKQACPEAVEEVKWRKPSNAMAGIPVWSNAPAEGGGGGGKGGGIICTGETYKNAVKLTFPKGAALPDPSRLFNASLEGGTRRAIDLHEGDRIDERALEALLRAAEALNASARDAARPAARGRS